VLVLFCDVRNQCWKFETRTKKAQTKKQKKKQKTKKDLSMSEREKLKSVYMCLVVQERDH